METRVKSDIFRELSDCFEKSEDCVIECRLKNSGKIVKITMKIEEEQTFTDHNGIVWVRK